jgi:ABC-type proline/glycine betaine transport system permease subunit
MEDRLKGRFWSGPVQTEENARYLISVVGWIFVAVGVVTLVVILAVPGGFLLTRKNRVSAAVLLVLSGLLFALSVAMFTYSVAIGVPHAVFMIILPLFWGPLAWMSWRALRAATFLRSLRRGIVMANEVFG